MRDNGNGKCCNCTTRLSICNLGMSLGIVWALAVFGTALLNIFMGIGMPFMHLFGSIYVGFESTILGAIFGLIWGFIHGFVGGALIAWLYNWCSCKCPCAYCKKNRKG